MKKMFFAVLALTFVSSLCFAQQPTAPVTKTTPKVVETKTVTAKVDSVTLGDATKKINSEITVVDENGEKLSFTVRTTTVINDKDGKAITLGKVEKGSKVIIEYTTTKKGTHKAKSIKLVG